MTGLRRIMRQMVHALHRRLGRHPAPPATESAEIIDFCVLRQQRHRRAFTPRQNHKSTGTDR